jgi:hypothetical protein
MSVFVKFGHKGTSLSADRLPQKILFCFLTLATSFLSLSAELAHIIAVCTFGASLQKVHIRLCPIKALPVEPMQFCVALHRKLRISYTLLRHQDAEFIVDNHYCDGKEVLFC